MVADYAHVTIFDAEEMDCLTFWGLEKDAYIYQAQQTEKGKDYLESCWVNSQVQPDREALRELFGIKRKKRKEGEQREEV